MPNKAKPKGKGQARTNRAKKVQQAVTAAARKLENGVGKGPKNKKIQRTLANVRGCVDELEARVGVSFLFSHADDLDYAGSI